ncbi:MobF family relaxase [Nonomuraea sp. NPDC004354]
MTVKITTFTVGEAGIAYHTEGEGCGHDHERAQDPAYWFEGKQRTGRWHGAGVAHLGLTAGDLIDKDVAMTVYGKLADPQVVRVFVEAAEARIAAEGLEGEQAEELRAQARAEGEAAGRLGNKPYRYKTLDERVAARIKKESVHATLTPERVQEIQAEEAQKLEPKARSFYDVTFTASKSTSLFYAALIAAGRDVDAELMRDMHRESVQEALDYLQQHAGYSRAGHHGKAPAGRASVGRWVDGHEWVIALFDHQTNRELEPHLHTHALVLNKVRTVDADGTVKWRALDGAHLFKMVKAAAAIYERGVEQRMEAHFAVAYAMRPDGKAREIVGISEMERAELSTRSKQIAKAMPARLAKFEEKHGRQPNQLELANEQRAAAKATRKPKQKIGSSSELLRLWEGMVGERLGTSLTAILGRAEAAAIEARELGDAERWETHVVITQAIDRVQEAQSTWTRQDLMFALNEVLPDRLGPSVLAKQGYTVALLERLADEALSGSYGVVQTKGLELLAVPEELRRADGRSMYQAGYGERYATVAHLTDEQWVEARAAGRGGEKLGEAAVTTALADAERRGRPLSEDQAAVADWVLNGGRDIDVVIGPAGTGKSVVQGVIAKAWEASGRRVIGLAPSNKAAEVLQAEGLRFSFNTTRFLKRAEGKGPRHEVEVCRLRPGDLLILDEAGMATTADIVAIAELAADAGAKLVLVGDYGQLTAVGAGGLFRQLARRDSIELGTVRRFRDADGTPRAWEAEASLGLREGNVHALQPYRSRGLIRSGTVAEMMNRIRRLCVADLVRGVYSAVMTATAEQAATLSGAIRDDLVRLGRVEVEGVRLADGTYAGVGDRIQVRENRNKLKDSHDMPVYNRFTYQVLSRHESGALTVQRIAERDTLGREVMGGTVTLPASYVSRYVELAYAGTFHANQGDTVEVGYELVTSATSREQLYVGATRGWRENRLFVGLEEGEEELAVLAGALARTQAQESASDTLAADLEWIESLGAHAPIWMDLVEQHQRGKYAGLLREAMGEAVFERLEAEDASTIYRQLWAAELAGHDGQALIQEVTGRDFDGVRVIPAALHTRIEVRLANRTPEREAAGSSWVERTPADMSGGVGEQARARAEAMDARVAAIGERAISEPPAWAVERLGPVPDDPIDRELWKGRVAQVEAYRELYAVDTPSTVIGPPPGRSMVAQRAAWEAAHEAMGRTADELRLADTPVARLREQVEIWEREQEWAPPSVAEELSRADWERLELQQRVALTQAEMERTADAVEREQLRERFVAEEQQLQRAVGYAEEVEQQQRAREAWHKQTRSLREEAEVALAEMLRRMKDNPEAGPREPVAETEQTVEEPSQQQREADSFARLAERFAGVERAEPDAREQTVEEPSPEQREQQAFAELRERWAAAQEREAGREPEVAELKPRVSERVLEELRAAQDRQADPEKVSVRERTERGAELEAREPEVSPREMVEQQVAEVRTEQQQAMVRLAERLQGGRERGEARAMEDITREQHYARQREQEQVQAREIDGPVLER